MEDKRYIASVNVGSNPTFDVANTRLEAHLLDYEGDLYGKRITVEFYAHIRDEKTFSDAEALKKQIVLDEKQIKNLFEDVVF